MSPTRFVWMFFFSLIYPTGLSSIDRSSGPKLVVSRQKQCAVTNRPPWLSGGRKIVVTNMRACVTWPPACFIKFFRHYLEISLSHVSKVILKPLGLRQNRFHSMKFKNYLSYTFSDIKGENKQDAKWIQIKGTCLHSLLI